MIDNKSIRKVIMLNKMLGGSPTYEDREASGAIANFTTNTVQPFVSVDCEILPKQEGTGDPSPSNPRPISGTSTLDIYHSGADTSDYDTISVPLGRTIYGGTADVVGGVGTKNKYIELTGEETEQWRFVDADHIGLLTVADLYSRNTANNLCNLFAVQSLTGWGHLADKSVGFLVSSSSGLNTIGIKNTDWNSITDMKTFLASNTVQLYYELQTPTEYTFTGQPINSFEGVNNVWTDSGNIEVTYKYKTGEGGSSKKKYLPIFYDLYGKDCRHL